MPQTVIRAFPKKEAVGITDGFHQTEYVDAEGQYRAEVIAVAETPEAAAQIVRDDYKAIRRPRENTMPIGSPDEVRYYVDSDVQRVVVNVSVEVPS